MTVACLGWGSLIWDPRTLPVTGGWRSDGPALPVEFARQSQNGRITLVIVANANPIPVLWTVLNVATLALGRAALGQREGIPERRWNDLIADWSAGTPSRFAHADAIGEWARARHFSAAVWTALGPRFGDADVMPDCAQVIAHLRALPADTQKLAEKYIRCAPAQIRTACRAAIEDALGWTPIADCTP
jgi:hypothetical protein